MFFNKGKEFFYIHFMRPKPYLFNNYSDEDTPIPSPNGISKNMRNIKGEKKKTNDHVDYSMRKTNTLSIIVYH